MTYEEETEANPFSPEVEAALLRIVLDRAPSQLEQVAGAKGDDEAFVHLPRATAAAFHLGQFGKARAFSEQCLALAPMYATNWNYGNAIHVGHTVLGLLALQSGNHQAAIAELQAAGATPGSPQINSFGPTMQLAKSLLKAGYAAPVLEYLQQCRTFWEMGGTWLDLWERKVRAGQIPNFFQHTHV